MIYVTQTRNDCIKRHNCSSVKLFFIVFISLFKSFPITEIFSHFSFNAMRVSPLENLGDGGEVITGESFIALMRSSRKESFSKK